MEPLFPLKGTGHGSYPIVIRPKSDLQAILWKIALFIAYSILELTQFQCGRHFITASTSPLGG